jgi:hypothetical protein
VATEQRITLPQFQDLLDRLGPETDQWPARDRADAEALLARSAPAQQILEDARMLKAALSGPATPAPAGLAQRIIDAALTETSVPEKAGDRQR